MPAGPLNLCVSHSKEFRIYFYAIDGDDIGKRLEEYALKDDIGAISNLSQQVKERLCAIQEYLIAQDATIIFCEGDSILATSVDSIDLPMQLLLEPEISFSAGIGTTPGLSLLALKKAKGLGKRRVESFSHLLP